MGQEFISECKLLKVLIRHYSNREAFTYILEKLQWLHNSRFSINKTRTLFLSLEEKEVLPDCDTRLKVCR